MNKFLVTITMINSVGRTTEAKVIENDRVGVARTIINYKPLRGYEIVGYLVTPFRSLL